MERISAIDLRCHADSLPGFRWHSDAPCCCNSDHTRSAFSFARSDTRPRATPDRDSPAVRSASNGDGFGDVIAHADAEHNRHANGYQITHTQQHPDTYSHAHSDTRARLA